jgi:hypothetical protein
MYNVRTVRERWRINHRQTQMIYARVGKRKSFFYAIMLTRNRMAELFKRQPSG